MKPIYFLSALTTLVFLSCEESKDNEFIQTGNYSLVISDSIEISRMIEAPNIVSTHPQSGNLLLLALEGSNSMVIVMNQAGEILKEFEYPKEGPKSAGPYLISATFFEDGYALLGYGSLVIYDVDFNVNKRIKLPVSLSGSFQIHSNHLKVIEKDGRPQFLLFFKPETERKITEAEYYQQYNLLTLVDPLNGTIHPYGKFHEESMFRSGKAYYLIEPVFETKTDETKVIVSRDTVMYTFDNAGNELDRVKIPFDNYITPKGNSLGERGLAELHEAIDSDAEGTVTNLINVDGFDVISYNSGIPFEKIQDIDWPDDQYESLRAFYKANPKKVLILKDGKLVSDVVYLPITILKLGESDQYGNIWASQDVDALDNEPSVVTIYKLRVVEN